MMGSTSRLEPMATCRHARSQLSPESLCAFLSLWSPLLSHQPQKTRLAGTFDTWPNKTLIFRRGNGDQRETVNGARNPTKTSCPHPVLWQQRSLPRIPGGAWAQHLPVRRGSRSRGLRFLVRGHIPKPQEARSLASLQALAVGGRRMPCGFLAPSSTSEPLPFKEGRKVQASSSTVAFRNCLKLFGPGRGS